MYWCAYIIKLLNKALCGMFYNLHKLSRYCKNTAYVHNIINIKYLRAQSYKILPACMNYPPTYVHNSLKYSKFLQNSLSSWSMPLLHIIFIWSF